MKVSAQETIIINRIAHLVRATRKQLGLSQETIAEKLGLIQSALSRIETGSQMLSAPQWAEFCQFTGISPDSIMSGYVDLKRPSKLKQDDRDGTFRIPKKYAKNRGSKVRALLPLLNYFAAKLGEESLQTFLKSQRIDPDFFICLDNQININFYLDVAEHLSKAGVLGPKDFGKLSAGVMRPEVHGVLHYQYMGRTDPAELLKLLVANSTYYECNFEYSVVDTGKKKVDLAIVPNEHLESTNYRNHPVLGDFLCQYKKHYFSRFTSFGGHDSAELKEIECHYKGADKCVYQMDLSG